MKKNYDEALIWLNKSAAQNHPLALFHLAGMYKNCQGVEKDEAKANELYSQAAPRLQRMAESGNANAQHALGLMYGDGLGGVQKDETQAAAWIQKAVDQRLVGAMNSLGYIYELGIGLPKDTVACVAWYRKAADMGDLYGQYNMGRMYEEGIGVEKDQAQAMTWYKKAADRGYEKAPVKVAMLYDSAEGVLKDDSQAVTWYQKAADLGDGFASLTLGKKYESGDGVPLNLALALRWYQKAADQGNKDGLTARESFDTATGLLLHMDLKWGGIDGVTVNPELEALVSKALKAYTAGLNDMGQDLLQQAIKIDPLILYMNNDWCRFYQHNVSPSVVSELLLAVKPQKQDRADFWFDYAHNANLAGQPILALAGTQKLKALISSEQDIPRARLLKGALALVTANAYLQTKRDNEAYAVLLEHGEFNKDDVCLVNYINLWATPLLKDKDKLSILTGIAKEALTGKYKLPQSQPFHDVVSGKLVKRPPQAQQEKVIEQEKPAVEILD